MDDIEEVDDDEEDDRSAEYTVKERRCRPVPKLDVIGPVCLPLHTDLACLSGQGV